VDRLLKAVNAFNAVTLSRVVIGTALAFGPLRHRCIGLPVLFSIRPKVLDRRDILIVRRTLVAGGIAGPVNDTPHIKQPRYPEGTTCLTP
jgi:hypothetical protein